MEFCHTSVLFSQCMEGLAIRPEGIYLDGTAGGGGHSLGIARRLTTGRLIALDKDPDAVKAAGERLAGLPARVVESDWTASCWTWGSPPTSWTPRSGGSPTWPTPPWICG